VNNKQRPKGWQVTHTCLVELIESYANYSFLDKLADMTVQANTRLVNKQQLCRLVGPAHAGPHTSVQQFYLIQHS